MKITDSTDTDTKVDEERPSPTRPTLQRNPTFLGLQLSCYMISHEGFLLHAPVDHAIARRKNRGVDGEESLPSFWIDVNIREGEDSKELQQLIEDIRLNSFLRRHLAQTHQITTPQVLSLSKALFMVMRVLPSKEDTSNEIRYVAALAVRGLLLTVTTFPKDGQAAAAGWELNVSTRKSVEERELPEASTSGALALWLLFHVQRVATVSQALRKTCFALDEALDEGIDSIELADIVDLKNQINLQTAVTEEQWECLETLKEAEPITTGLDFSKLNGTMGLVMATAGANERMAGRLAKKVADLRLAYDSHRQDKINHRLGLLTIISAIFLPLTLMAGKLVCSGATSDTFRVLHFFAINLRHLGNELYSHAGIAERKFLLLCIEQYGCCCHHPTLPILPSRLAQFLNEHRRRYLY